MGYVRAFGVFWYDFLVGDRPELFLGSIGVLAVVWAAINIGLSSTLAGGLLTVGVLLLAGFSLWFATQPRR
jgi:Flp pilus assembly protein protease CpaA